MAEPRTGWVLYDADCGVCSHWIVSWRPTLDRLGLDVAPLQSPWVAERTRLPPGDLLADVRLLESHGRLISGANVYRYVLKRLWWGFPLYLLSSVPGLSSAFDWAYRTFARHRRRISSRCGVPRAG